MKVSFLLLLEVLLGADYQPRLGIPDGGDGDVFYLFFLSLRGSLILQIYPSGFFLYYELVEISTQ